MAYTLAVGGDPDRTSGYINSGYVYSPGFGFPVGNSGGPIKLYGVGLDYLTGGYARIYHGNSGTYQTGGGVLLSGGGSFSLEAVETGGTMYFGRLTTNGGTTYHNEGGSWQGALCGWLTWATISAPPTMMDAVRQPNGQVRVRFNGSGNTGGMPMTGWQLQYATNPSFSGATTVASSGTSDLTLAPGYTYYFHARGLNDVGWSAWSSAISLFVQAGGKRHNGSQFVNTTIARRFDGSNFINLATARRFDGSSWVNLS